MFWVLAYSTFLLGTADCAEILEQSMGARNRVGRGLSESVPPAYVGWRARTTNRAVVPARQATYTGRIDSMESIRRLLESIKIPSLDGFFPF
jgi:hypothetical protein